MNSDSLIVASWQKCYSIANSIYLVLRFVMWQRIGGFNLNQPLKRNSTSRSKIFNLAIIYSNIFPVFMRESVAQVTALVFNVSGTVVAKENVYKEQRVVIARIVAMTKRNKNFLALATLLVKNVTQQFASAILAAIVTF